MARCQYLDAITEHLTQGAFHAVQVTLAPALGIIVLVIGAFEVPIVYAITASALSFAAATTGLLRFSEWMQGIRIDDRLTFTRITQATDVDFSSGSPILKTAQYEILFFNNARFPLSFIVDYVHSTLENQTSQSPSNLAMNGLVSPRSERLFVGAPITVNQPIKDRMIGTLAFRIKYGRPGHERHILEKKLQVQWGFIQLGDFLTVNLVAQDAV
jgi:hypothetical protein